MSNSYFSLAGGDFVQDWTNVGLITTDDTWSGVPSIVGVRGDDLVTTTGIDPQTVTGTSTVVDVNANQTLPNSFSTGGLAEFELADPVVALSGSGTADAPSLVLHLDATGRENVTVSYLLRDLDGSVDNAVQPVALQYRIGESGGWINLPAGFVADATTGPSLATLTTPVSATLPSAVDGQAQVQVRIITANAVGNDEWVGVDDIRVTSSASAAAGVTVTQTGGTTRVAEGGATDSLTVVLNAAPSADVTITVATDGETTASPASLTFTPANWNVAQAVTVAAVDDAEDENLSQASSLTFGVASADARYQGLAVAPVSATVTDNDAPLVRISAVQGATAAPIENLDPVAGTFDDSPLLGQAVTVEAIVVGDFQTGDADGSRNLGGFFLQEEDADADGDAATSEGVFVFQGSLPTGVAIGDKVLVTGRVVESFGETQIDASVPGGSITVVSSGNALPTAAVLSLPTAGTTLSQNADLQPDLEAFEGMRVTIPDTLTVTEQFQLDRFNEIKLFDANGFEQAGPDGTTITGERPFTFTQYNDPDAAGFAAYQEELGARTITYDDGLNAQNQPISGLDGFEGYTTATAPRMGDTITGLTGVLDYKWAGGGASGATWRVRSTIEGENEFFAANPRPAEPVLVDGSLKVASFNVLNLFTTLGSATTESGGSARGATNAAELERQLDKLVVALRGLDADIVGLMEIENDFVDPAGSKTAIQTLVDALNEAEGSPVWSFVQPGVDQLGGDAIAVAMIYRNDKVAVAEGTAPAFLTDAQVAPDLLAQSTTGGIFDGANASRVPLAATFEEIGTGELLTVVVNHLKSKSGTGTGEDADQGDGAGSWTNQRELAVRALSAWLETDPTGSGTPNQLLIGDFNAYGEESPIDFLTMTAGFVDVAEALLGTAYSYLFDGQLGTLDYAFASLELFEQVVDALEWHINSDEADALDYNLDFGRDPAIFDGTEPFRASDHDPLLVGLSLDSVDPQLVSASPADAAVGVDAGADIVLTFDEAVFAGAGTITVTDGAGDVRVVNIGDAQVTIVGDTVTLDLATDLDEGRTYDVLVSEGALADDNGNTFGGLAADQLEFTVANYTLQILHASDFEAGLDAVDRAGNFAAIVDYLEDTQANSITLSSGDNYLPSPFFAAGSDPSLKEVYETALETYYGLAAGTLNFGANPFAGAADIAMLNLIGVEASAIGNHEFDAGTNPFASLIRQTATYPGVQFPYLSANLDFSGDANLASLFSSTIRPAEAFANLENGTVAVGPKLAPATIIEENGELIGVVGATTQIVESISSTGGVDVIGDDVNDMAALAAILQPTIDALIGQGIDKIILVSHLQQLALEQALAPLLRGVDVIIAGGSHTLLADAEDVTRGLQPGDAAAGTYPIATAGVDGKPTLIVNTSSEYGYVGRLVVEFDENGDVIPGSVDPTVSGAFATTDAGVADLYDTPIDIDGDGDLDSDPFVQGSRGDLVRDIASAVGTVIDAQDATTFGWTDVYLEGRRGEVRTEETNLGSLSADANLWYAQQGDDLVLVSIKNGGGIRDSIGSIEAVGGTATEQPPEANPGAGKEAGEVSQLDIANSLRFNNALTLLTLTPEQLKIVLEHAVAATTPTGTPGQFAQIGGIAFSFDATAQAQVLGNGVPTTQGQRVENAAIVLEDGTRIPVIRDGLVLDSAPDAIRVVTLTFLATGGDGYPFQAFVNADPTFANRVDLDPDASATDDAATRTGEATFTDNGREQDALAEYLAEFHGTQATAFDQADTTRAEDERIQNLAFRADTVIFGDAPTLVADLGTAGENQAKAFDLLANDDDAEGATLTLAGFEVLSVEGLALSVADAAAAFSIVDGKLSFAPGARFEALNAGQTATVTLSYAATDGANESEGAFTLTVTGETDFVAFPGGSARSDRITGTAGNDSIDAGARDDRVSAGEGFDLVRGGTGDDRIFGQGGDDLLYGDAGNDQIEGGAGRDLLAGGRGNDRLRGGEDSDLFVFLPGDGWDRIVDFAAEDVVQLSLSDFADFADLAATGLRSTGAGAEIRLDGGARLLLAGVAVGDLRADDFLFV